MCTKSGGSSYRTLLALETNMLKMRQLALAMVVVPALIAALAAQTIGQPEEFNAIAIQNNNLGSGSDRVIMRVTRWSSEAERARLVAALQKGSDALLESLRDLQSVGVMLTKIEARPIRN